MNKVTCDNCIKESVCKYKSEYEYDCDWLKKSKVGATTKISVTCSEFSEKQTLRAYRALGKTKEKGNE
jgi:hypothetical protein